MRRKIGSLEKSVSITRLTLAVSSAETRRAEGTATALAVLCSTAQLCRCSRLCCSGLTRGQKRQYSRDGNQSQNVPPKMPNMLGIGDRLSSHNHAERGVDTQDHFEIFRATCCVPSPARRPEDGERPYTEDKDKPYDHESDP